MTLLQQEKQFETLTEKGAVLGQFSSAYVQMLAHCPSASRRKLEIWSRQERTWIPLHSETRDIETDTNSRIPQLPADSVPMIIILTTLSLGCYWYFWFIHRSSALKNLRYQKYNRKSEKKPKYGRINMWIFWIALVSWSVFVGVHFMESSFLISSDSKKVFGIISAYLNLCTLLECAKISKALSNHTNHYRPTGYRFNTIASVLLGPFYLQYKINQVIESNPPKIL